MIKTQFQNEEFSQNEDKVWVKVSNEVCDEVWDKVRCVRYEVWPKVGPKIWWKVADEVWRKLFR